MLPKGTLEHAARIRRSLVRGRERFNFKRNGAKSCDGGPDYYRFERLDLGGVCGLASLELCLALGDTELKYLKGTTGHVWNAFPFKCATGEMIVDITATQFSDEGNLITLESGVFMGAVPQKFHRLHFYGDSTFKQGHALLDFMENDDWYSEPRLGATPGEIRRWRIACRMARSPAASSAPTARNVQRA